MSNTITPAHTNKARGLIEKWREEMDPEDTHPVNLGVAINIKTHEVKAYIVKASFDKPEWIHYPFGKQRQRPVDTELPQMLEAVAQAIANRTKKTK